MQTYKFNTTIDNDAIRIPKSSAMRGLASKYGVSSLEPGCILWYDVNDWIYSHQIPKNHLSKDRL